MTSDSNAIDAGNRNTRLATGIAWVLGFRIFDRLAGIVSIMTLARLLVPADFGVVSLGTAVAAFVELFGALSLDAVLIRKQDASRDDYDTAWTLQLTLALVCGTLLAAIAHQASVFFRQPHLENIIYVLAAAMWVEGWTNIRIIEFRKRMRFDLEFIFMASRRLATTAITITVAFALRNEWALVVGIVSGKVIAVILSYCMRPYWPRFSLASKQELLHASGWLFVANVVQFVRVRLSDFTLGRVSGATAVGAFNLANEMSTMVSTELVAPVNRVALPEFSSMENKTALARRFNQLTGQLAIFLMPLGMGLSVCSSLIVRVLFGDNWAMAGDALGILAIAYLISGLGSNIGVVFLAAGRFKENAMMQGIGGGLLAPLLAAGVYFFSFKGAAFAILTANSAVIVAAIVMLNRAIDYDFTDFLATVWRPLLAACAMALSIYPLLHANTWFGMVMPDIVRLIVTVIVGAAAYVLALAVIWILRGRKDDAENMTISLLSSALRALRRRLLGA